MFSVIRERMAAIFNDKIYLEVRLWSYLGFQPWETDFYHTGHYSIAHQKICMVKIGLQRLEL